MIGECFAWAMIYLGILMGTISLAIVFCAILFEVDRKRG